jgi:lysophospholipase L1-like esterase
MSKHRIVASLTALALAVTGVFVTAPSAGASPAPSRSWWQPAPYTYYLSLGDSLGFGFSDANLATFEAYVTDTDGVTDTSVDAAAASAFQGYTQLVAASLPKSVKDVENFSCPGETTSTMLYGDCAATAFYPGWPSGTEAQIDPATAYLAEHTSQRGVITLSIGADDVLDAIDAGQCLTDPTCPALQSAMQTANNNLKTILRDLRNAAPKATIVVLTPYNPFGKAYPVSNIAAVTFNMMIGWTALLNGARVADAFWPINVQHATTFDCGSLVYYCTDPVNSDVHPTHDGYGVIAGAIMKSIG